jgi:outer membrane receptor protein involved in Fe transport
VQPVDSDLEAFVRLQWSYTGDSNSILEPVVLGTSANPQFLNPAYNIGDIRFGVRGEDWEANLYVTNVTDERAILNHANGRYEYNFGNSIDGRANTARAYTVRPREVGIRFMKRWGG